MHWWVYFLTAWGLSLFGGIVLIWFCKKMGGMVKKMGGAVLISAFVFSVLFFDEIILTNQIKALLTGSFFILFFGLADNFKNFSWRPQLAFQIFLGVLLIISGFSIDYISNPLGGLWRLDVYQIIFFGHSFSVLGSLLIIGWVLILINAINWADGSDGLISGVSLSASVALFSVSLLPQVNQPAVAIMTLLFAGSIAGYLWFNFPPAKFEDGTSGSYFIGFTIAVLAIISGTKIATALIVLAVPLIDAVWVIIERINNKIPLSPLRAKDNRHLHHKLKRLGWSDRKIVFVYYIFIFITLAIALSFSERRDKFILLLLQGGVIIYFLWTISRKLDKKMIGKNNLKTCSH